VLFAVCLLESKTSKVVLEIILRYFGSSACASSMAIKPAVSALYQLTKSGLVMQPLLQEDLVARYRGGSLYCRRETGLVSSGYKKSLLKEVLNFNESSS